MTHNLKWTLQDIIDFLQSPVISKKTILIRACELRKELQQLFSNRPSWIVKENSKAADILGALAELQRWCDYAERQILGEN